LIVSSSVTIIEQSGPALPNLACMLATSSVNAEQAGETQTQLASATVLLLAAAAMRCATVTIGAATAFAATRWAPE